MDSFPIELSRDRAVVQLGAGLADEPIVRVVLKLAKFKIGERGNVRARDTFRIFWHDAIDASTLWKVDGISADVGVVPI